ncbi:MAG: hypothetical protein LBI80_00520 [Endomicrobium sp.]|jgi:hypothetical protein|nr:hypothetical protein [Endomicrobium sp.]
MAEDKQQQDQTSTSNTEPKSEEIKKKENVERNYDIVGLVIGGVVGLIVGIIISFNSIFAMQIGMFLGLVLGVNIKKK